MKNSKKNRNSGQVALAITIMFTVFSIAVVTSLITPIVKEVGGVRDLGRSKQSYFLAEASLEDVLYRIQSGKQYSPTETLTIDGNTATTSVVTVLGKRVISSSGNVSRGIRKAQVVLSLGSGSAFFYGIQTGQGGFILENNSSVTGSIYSDGSVVGSGTANGSATVYGDVVSAGSSGEVNTLHATGTVYAHTIIDSKIDKDAYYRVLTNTTVGGVAYPGSPDQDPASLPIDDATVNDYELAAESGGVISSPCPYVISTNVTLGPKKINCDVVVEGTPTVTLTGNLWIVGNLTTQNSSVFKVNSSLGPQSIAIIADNPANRTTSSKISLQNTTTFFGSGATTSYVLLVSQNNSAELGGNETAIEIKNSATGKLLAYAAHGEIGLENSASLKELTAHTVRLKNSSNVIYETGLQSLLFSAGPSGGYQINSWNEVE